MSDCAYYLKTAMGAERAIQISIYPAMLLIFGLTELYVSIDDVDKHSTFVLRDKIQQLEETYEESFDKKLMLHIRNKVIEMEGEENLVSKENFARYEKKIERLCEFVRIFKPELENIEIEKKDDEDFYKCRLRMVYDGYSLDKEFESKGIKKIMDLFECLDAASEGHVVFIDELDANVSDVYLGRLIEYFLYYGEGQLCFTAHNLSPMSILKDRKEAIHFISSINTVHTWKRNGNNTPENAYRNGFIEDSPFNMDASDFLGILGGDDE